MVGRKATAEVVHKPTAVAVRKPTTGRKATAAAAPRFAIAVVVVPGSPLLHVAVLAVRKWSTIGTAIVGVAR